MAGDFSRQGDWHAPRDRFSASRGGDRLALNMPRLPDPLQEFLGEADGGRTRALA